MSVFLFLYQSRCASTVAVFPVVCWLFFVIKMYNFRDVLMIIEFIFEGFSDILLSVRRVIASFFLFFIALSKI